MELYVYYRVPAHARDAAWSEVRQRQAAMTQRWPDLMARLLWRANAAGPDITCMETYAHPQGLDDAQCVEIEAQMAACPGQRIGPRHAERFTPCPAEGHGR